MGMGKVQEGASEVCREERAMSNLIRRSDAINAMWKALYAYEDLTEKQFMEHEELELGDWFKHRIFVQRMHEECMKAVEALPSAEAVQGEWIPFDRTYGRSIWVCSACDNGTYVPCDAFTQKPIYDYCPNCGARMRGEEE